MNEMIRETSQLPNDESYKLALNNLKRFQESDLGKTVKDLDDLLFQMAFVERGLRTVIAAKGTVKETKYQRSGQDYVDTRIVLSRPFADDTITFGISGSKTYIHCGRSDIFNLTERNSLEGVSPGME